MNEMGVAVLFPEGDWYGGNVGHATNHIGDREARSFGRRESLYRKDRKEDRAKLTKRTVMNFPNCACAPILLDLHIIGHI